MARVKNITPEVILGVERLRYPVVEQSMRPALHARNKKIYYDQSGHQTKYSYSSETENPVMFEHCYFALVLM